MLRENLSSGLCQPLPFPSEKKHGVLVTPRESATDDTNAQTHPPFLGVEDVQTETL